MDSERVRPALAPTGDSRVDAAIGGLASLDDMDLADRPAVLEQVHDRLREILGELGDSGKGEPGRPTPAAPARPGERGEQGELGDPFRPGTQQPQPGQPRPGDSQRGESRPGEFRPAQQPGAPAPGVPGPGSWSRRPDA